MKPIESFYPFLVQLPKRIVITFHQKPDADAMGSALGLLHFLRHFHHKIQIISPTNWASYLHWMPGTKYVMDGEKYVDKAQKEIAEADFIFVLDCNDFARTKTLENAFLASRAIKILIDHHEKPKLEQFDYGVSTPSKSSTAEMVYDLMVDAGYKKVLQQEIATVLYAGIMTDTGSFRFSNTTARVHEIVSVLKKTGFSHTLVHQNLFDVFSEERLKFMGFVLLHRLVVRLEQKTAIVFVTKEDIETFHIQTGDTEGLVHYPMSLKHIEFVALIIDRGEEVRCSFRSKEFFNVNEFARAHFEGGGHIMAAGGRSSLSLEETIQKFWTAVDGYKALGAS